MISPNLRKGARVRVSFDGEVVKIDSGIARISVIGGNHVPTVFGLKDVPRLRVELLDDIMVAEVRQAPDAPSSAAPKPPAASTAPDLLRRAAEIMDERGREYEAAAGERSMGKVVKALNAVLGREVMTERDGWIFMVLLKYVRASANTKVPHADSYHDAIAYAALAGESALLGGK